MSPNGSANPIGRFGRSIVRVAPLLAAVVFLVMMGWLGTRGQGPLGRIDALRSVGGLPPVAEADRDEPGGPGDGRPGGSVPGDGQYSGLPTEPGLCATWAQTEPEADRRTHRAACQDPHLLEVAATFEIDGTPYGADGPVAADWMGAPSDRCDDLITEYLGYPLDERGRFRLNIFFPVAEQWRRGDRTVICGISSPAPQTPDAAAGDTLVPITGRVAGADQTVQIATGTCYSGRDASLSEHIDCDQPHGLEVVGTVDVPGAPGDPYPGVAGIAALATEPCRVLAVGVYGAELTGDVHAGVAELPESSWQVGARSVACVMGRTGADGAWVTVDAPVRAVPPG